MSRQFPFSQLSTHRLWQCLCALLLLTLVLNGSVFWLQRTGLLAPEKYQYYLANFDHPPGYQRSIPENQALHAFIADLYQTPGWLALTKIFKDIWLLLFVIVALYVQRVRLHLRLSTPNLLLAGIGLCLLIGFWRGYQAGGWLLPALGLRGFGWLLLAVLGAWAATADKLARLGRGLLGVLVIQAMLLPMELIHGLHVFGARFFGTDFGDRVVGTLLQPSSLGVFAVLAATAFGCFTAVAGRSMVVVFLLAGVVVFFTASATALGLGLLMVAWWLCRAVRSNMTISVRSLVWVGVGAALVLLYFLPEISGRALIFDSLWGRLWLFEQQVLAPATPAELWLGQGLGVGSNAALNAAQYGVSLPAEKLFVADSTPAVLIAQIGIIGCVCCYSLMVWAMWYEQRYRPLYALLLLASLSLNIFEFFPAVVVLGLLLASRLSRNAVPSVA